MILIVLGKGLPWIEIRQSVDMTSVVNGCQGTLFLMLWVLWTFDNW